jgi:hypothetical protein
MPIAEGRPARSDPDLSDLPIVQKQKSQPAGWLFCQAVPITLLEQQPKQQIEDLGRILAGRPSAIAIFEYRSCQL